ncbi:MAG: hypothetical protein M1819_002351 [Sarea resinae]|nr:MAG: hypothetical protein M1819_002351 [Sarea resinae]
MAQAREFKLKGISKLDLKNFEKREADVEGVEDGKVLIVKYADKVHATSPNCTHYGAPLMKGVVTGEGRLTCPWHGACFSVATGDVEDAPALDPLAKFEVYERDGAVYIRGDEEEIINGRRETNFSCLAEGSEKVVIIGGGSGTIGALHGLRGGGYKGHITVISQEDYPPIDRTKLSKALLADVSKAAWHSADFYSDADIDRITDRVTKVDFGGKTVTGESGKQYQYTKLILASGGTPKQLPLPGFKDLKNVFLLRTLTDTKAIVSAVGDNGKKIVVIGSSFIGMEVSNCLANLKNDVTCVGKEQAPLEAVMGPKVGNIFKSLVEKNGVKFKLGADVEKAVPSAKDPSKVGSVQLKDGTVLEADLVIVGVGVSPATEFLRDAKEIQLEKDGSVRTDEEFAVEGPQDVFAIGDIATYPYHGPGGNGKYTRIEHWNVAQNAGRSVAKTIMNPCVKPKQFIPIFWSALGAQLRYCGNTTNGWDDLVLKGEPNEGKFAAYYCLGETVVAVASMQMDPVMTKCAELMRRLKMPTKSELQKGVDVLDINVPAEIKI